MFDQHLGYGTLWFVIVIVIASISLRFFRTSRGPSLVICASVMPTWQVAVCDVRGLSNRRHHFFGLMLPHWTWLNIIWSRGTQEPPFFHPSNQRIPGEVSNRDFYWSTKCLMSRENNRFIDHQLPRFFWESPWVSVCPPGDWNGPSRLVIGSGA